MSQQTINVGAAPNDGTGTPLRTAFQYTNSNFSELYTAVGPSGNNIVVPGTATITGDLTVDTSTLKVDSTNNRVGIGTASPAYKLHVGDPTLASVGTSIDSLTQTSHIFKGTPDASGYEYAKVVSGRDTTAYTYGSYLAFYTEGKNSGTTDTSIERLRIDSTGICTWSNVGGVAGTAMTLNSTGLGIGGSPVNPLTVFAAASAKAPALLLTNAGSPTYGWDFSVDGAVNGNLFIRRLVAGVKTDVLEFDRSNGNLGIGVTPSARFHSKAGAVTQGGIIETTGANALLSFADAGTSSYTRVQIGSSGNNLAAFINSVQAMTLDASGNLLVKKTAVGDTSVGFQATASGVVTSTRSESTDGTGTSYVLYSTGASAYRFYIGMGGTVFATNTTISAISDQRLKENVQDIDVGLGAILALKPRKFDWKAGKGKDIKGDRGFIAQEFEQVFPNLIDEWKDAAPEGEAPYKSVRQDLIPVLVKAIQELTARVEALEA